ncbi:ABC transporter ATP-binding protein [Jidongwangia harbinensis]|uniref:ABC transporter ATP-binding protein n=1 Tax=Jidongwangia harbinensis TaxID=2878561 RepID=UPI001CDA2CCF|nr:ABC transporter ATP-binding protein [Jidongwangia harbinensis]MCA2215609.1 ABC transporter ATP-binding protein/permease [Jidongwangia harbinensis]
MTAAERARNRAGGRLLRQAVAGQRRLVAVGAVLAVGHQAGEALVPVLIGTIVDEAVATGSGAALIRWLLVLAVVFAGLSACYRFAARAGERAAEQAAHDLRRRLARRVVAPAGGAETGRLPGELVNVASADAARVGAVNMAVTAGAAAFAALATTAVVLLQMSVPLGLVVLLGAPPVLLLAQVLGRPLQRRSETEQENAGHAAGVAADLVAGIRVLKGIGAEGTALARYRRISRSSLRATIRAADAQAGHDGALVAVSGVFIAAVALVGARLALRGDITVGDLIAAVGLALFLLGPLSIVTWVNGQLAQARGSAVRVAEVLDAPPAVPPATREPDRPVRGELVLQDVADGPLRVPRLRIAPGEFVGVVALDPAAGTALVRALAREADPAAGTVRLDDRPLTELEPAAVRAVIGTAQHDSVLFDDTVRDTVAGPGEAPADRVRLTAVLAGTTVDELVRTLPDGLDTRVGDRGRALSGGQRQRLVLARALAAEPPVLVLHDPTTAVDAVTEAHIADRLRALRAGRTTVLVTTSPALLAVADRVVVLSGDADPVTGTHAALVRDDARYAAAVLA